MHLYNVSKTSSMLEDSPPFDIIWGLFPTGGESDCRGGQAPS